MANSSGLGHTTGIVEESTYGVTPSLTGIRGYDVDSNGLVPRKVTVQGGGLRGGGFLPRGNRRVVVSVDAAGSIAMDMPTKGAGRLLKAMLGQASIAQQGTTTAFLQGFNIGDRRGKSLAVQSGIPDTDSGTIVPFTFSGCKVIDWEIGLDNKGLLKLSLTLDARDGVTTVAYTAPDYTLAAAAGVFGFAAGNISINGSPAAGVKSFSFKGTEPVNTDRYFLNNLGRKSEQLNNGWWDITATLDVEFTNKAAFVDKWYSDEAFGLTTTCVGRLISAEAGFEQFQIVAPAVKMDGEPPAVDGTDTISHTVTCKVVDSGAPSPLTINYISTDTVA